jgi:hypothetical protein
VLRYCYVMDTKQLWQWAENESFVTTDSNRTIIIALVDR